MNNMGTKTLETERLILRKVNNNDLDDLFKNWSSDKITTEFLTFKPHTQKEETQKFIDSWIKKYDKNGYEWVIQLKDNNEVIGVISGDKTYKYKCIELGYSISSKYFNKGIMTEALKKVIDYLLFECDFNIIEVIIPGDNISSIKVAIKCGLTKEATLKRRYLDKKNRLQDLYIYSLFKKEN